MMLRMKSPPWESVSESWSWDGSWRDAYVFDTDGDDWQRVVDLVRRQGWEARTNGEGGVESPLPAEVRDIFALDSTSPTWLIRPGAGVEIKCHFFAPEEIEFDLDPRQITDQSSLDVVCEFLRAIGRELRKPVVVTAENDPAWTIMRYDPRTDEIAAGDPLP